MRTYKRRRPEYQVIEGVEELCRLCLEKCEESVPIFTDNSDNFESTQTALSLRIMMCVGIEITNDENLPNQICSACHKELESCHRFRKKCELSYQKLKYHLLAVKEKEAILKDEMRANVDCDLAVLNNNPSLVFTVNSDGTVQISESSNRNNCLNSDQLVSLLRKVEPIAPDPVENNKSLIVSSDTLASGDNEVSNNERKTQHNPPNHIGLTVDNTALAESNTIVVKDTEPCLDLSRFLTNTLLELGVISQDGDHIVLHPGTDNLELETEDGCQITFEIVEEDGQINETPLQPTIKEKQKTSADALTTSKKKDSESSPRELSWCTVCGKTLVNRGALARHMRDVHERARPHACARCGKTFAQRNVMIRHMLVHDAKRPHQCPLCSKSFTQRGALDTHRRTHTPPHQRAMHIYQCPKCPKVFLYHSGLSRHMQGAHAGKLHWCQNCERPFTDRSSLARHLKLTGHERRADAQVDS